MAQPMPDAPCLPLTGGGTADMSLEDFLKELEADFSHHQGYYREYVLGHHSSLDEADHYFLESWDVYEPRNNTHEALVVLYYSPVNPLSTLKKHMPDMVDDYLADCASIEWEIPENEQIEPAA
ncbi:MAG: hypothetical protein AAGF01_06000 [Cyanobacteria bacterium P01_G01_bin.38]